MIEAIIQGIGDIVKQIWYWIINNPTLALWSGSVILVGAVMIYLSLKSKSIKRARFFSKST